MYVTTRALCGAVKAIQDSKEDSHVNLLTYVEYILTVCTMRSPCSDLGVRDDESMPHPNIHLKGGQHDTTVTLPPGLSYPPPLPLNMQRKAALILLSISFYTGGIP